MPESYVNDPLPTHLKRDMTALFGSIRNLGLLALLAILAGMSGPFGTYGAMPGFERHLYWLLIVIGTAAAGHMTASAVEHYLRRTAWSAITRMLTILVLTSLPVFGVLAAILFGFGFRPSAEETLALYFQCTAVIGGVMFLQAFVAPARREPETSSASKLMMRLPGAKRGRLIRLAAQDHYVDVITENGRALVPIRFRDAIAEAAPEPGAQVHRSHWVALHAVAGRSRTNDRISLRLSDGSVIPVGRKFRPYARQKGLLKS